MIIRGVCSVSTTLGDRDNCGSFPGSRNAIDKLNSLVSTGVILEAVILSIFPVMPSGPHALVVFNILNTAKTLRLLQPHF